MPDVVTAFRCENCGAPLRYSEERFSFFCAYCGGHPAPDGAMEAFARERGKSCEAAREKENALRAEEIRRVAEAAAAAAVRQSAGGAASKEPASAAQTPVSPEEKKAGWFHWAGAVLLLLAAFMREEDKAIPMALIANGLLLASIIRFHPEKYAPARRKAARFSVWAAFLAVLAVLLEVLPSSSTTAAAVTLLFLLPDLIVWQVKRRAWKRLYKK